MKTQKQKREDSLPYCVLSYVSWIHISQARLLSHRLLLSCPVDCQYLLLPPPLVYLCFLFTSLPFPINSPWNGWPDGHHPLPDLFLPDRKSDGPRTEGENRKWVTRNLGKSGAGPIFFIRVVSPPVNFSCVSWVSSVGQQNTATPLLIFRNDATCAADGNNCCSLLSDMAAARYLAIMTRSKENTREKDGRRQGTTIGLVPTDNFVFITLPLCASNLTSQNTDINFTFNSDIPPRSALLSFLSLFETRASGILHFGQLQPCILTHTVMHHSTSASTTLHNDLDRIHGHSNLGLETGRLQARFGTRLARTASTPKSLISRGFNFAKLHTHRQVRRPWWPRPRPRHWPWPWLHTHFHIYARQALPPF